MDAEKRTAFAISGLGGNNAYGAGFLAAVREATNRRGVTTGLYPGLEMSPARPERSRVLPPTCPGETCEPR